MKNSAPDAVTVPRPQMSEEDQRRLLEIQNELVEALAELPPHHQEVLLAIGAGASIKEIAEQVALKVQGVHAVLRTKRAQEIRTLLVRRWALEYGVPRAWKREQLVWIIDKHRADTPAAAIAALRLLAEIDGDTDPALIHVEDNRQIVVNSETLHEIASKALEYRVLKGKTNG